MKRKLALILLSSCLLVGCTSKSEEIVETKSVAFDGLKTTVIESENSNQMKSKSNSYNTCSDSYNDGYDDIYCDEDYDIDRYDNEDTYADGVDDAMEDWDEEGEDW